MKNFQEKQAAQEITCAAALYRFGGSVNFVKTKTEEFRVISEIVTVMKTKLQ